MSAKEMSGIPVAEKILDEIKREAGFLKTKEIIPGPGTIMVGDDPNCRHYVNKKHKSCVKYGYNKPVKYI